VPEGLGVEIAERSDSNFHDKGNVRSKQLLDNFYKQINAILLNTQLTFTKIPSLLINSIFSFVKLWKY
jgi:hypothetical protein